MSRLESFVNVTFSLCILMITLTVCLQLLLAQISITVSGVEPSTERGNRISNGYSALVAILAMYVGSMIKPKKREDEAE